MIALLAALATAGAPLTVEVDSKAIAVELVCGSNTLRANTVNGVATFDTAPANCEVHTIYPIGSIPGPGIYKCDAGNCILQDVPHRATSDAAGRINVIVQGYTGWMELTCADGYRERADIVENVATFENVKGSDCILHFKGSTPAQYRPMTTGTWRCALTGTTAVCRK